MNELRRELTYTLKDDLKVYNQNKHVTHLSGAILYLLDNHFNSIVKWFDETVNGNSNNGILFYLAGFDGKKQQEYEQFFKDQFNVNVF